MPAPPKEMRFGGLTGTSGELRFGGRVAGRFGRWDIELKDAATAAWVFRTNLTESVPDWLDAGPLDLRAEVQVRDPDHPDWGDVDKPVPSITRIWRWRGVEVVTIMGKHIMLRGSGEPELL